MILSASFVFVDSKVLFSANAFFSMLCTWVKQLWVVQYPDFQVSHQLNVMSDGERGEYDRTSGHLDAINRCLLKLAISIGQSFSHIVTTKLFCDMRYAGHFVRLSCTGSNHASESSVGESQVDEYASTFEQTTKGYFQ